MLQPIEAPQHVNGKRSVSDRLWPFGGRAAVLAVPLIAIALLVAIAILRTVADWPRPESDNLVLTGVLLLAVLPLALVLIDIVASRGGKIGFRSFRVDFAGVSVRASQVTIPANIALPDVPVSDHSSFELTEMLRAATGSDIVVVDLKDGEAWWETRLLVLCAAGARVGHPVVVVFVATDRGMQQRFQGWAPPGQLLRALLRADRRYLESHRAALAAAGQWALVPPPPEGQAVKVPPDASELAQMSWIAFTGREPNELAAEQFLAVDLGRKVEPHEPRGVTVVRLHELFLPVLRANAIETSWPEDRRIELMLASDAAYLAITDHGRYLGLLSRVAAQNMVLSTLIPQPNAGPPRG